MTLPFVSVVVPTFSRPRHIRACIQALSELDYPPDRFEVLVVDDGSPEPVASILQPEPLAISVRCLRQEQAGPAKARNLGLENASGDLVAFTDDDCKPRRNWLSAFAQAHLRNPEAAFSGPVRNAVQSSAASEASQVLIDYCIGYFNLPETGRGFFTSNNMAFPAAKLRALGGFCAGFPLAAAEDRELCARWSDHGYPFLFAQDAVVDHFHHLDLRRFVRQQFNYGRGAWFFQRARAAQGNRSVRVEPIRFYSGMFRAAFRGQTKPRSLQICGLLVLSQAMTAAGFFSERRRGKSSPSQITSLPPGSGSKPAPS